MSANASQPRRVVVTGIGTISALGHTLEDFWGSLTKGRSGIARVTRFDPTDFPSKVGAEVRDFDPGKYMDPKEAKRERKRESKAHDGTLVFYSVLAKEGLFSIQDSRSARRWYKLGATVEGWKLEAFDVETNVLTVSQGTTHQELHLYKSSIEASASELSTVVTVRPGEVVKIPGVGGLEVSVSATVSAGGTISGTPVPR